MINYLIKDNEYFYGGAINDGTKMPFDKNSEYEINFDEWHSGNQACILYFSNLGNIFYAPNACKVTFSKGKLSFSTDDVKSYHVEGGLREIHKFICENIFKPCDSHPDENMFIHPQFNTWIEMGKEVNEDKVLKYAHDILENGYKPGVLMIDDKWNEEYGTWDFDKTKFKDPKGMVKKLHDLGFKVILWICPYVDFDTPMYNKLVKEDVFLLNSKGEVYGSTWWNGTSAVLDLTKEKARNWIEDRFKYLMETYDIDGFKLDAGDPEWYLGDIATSDGSSRADQARIWCEIGEKYSYSELRVAFNNGISPIAHRLRDKWHSWDNDGINTLIPNSITMGLLGYPFFCPDMIGGGVLPDFEKEDFVFDQELFVRYCEIAAMLPMMQFSLSPWKCLDEDKQKICLKMAETHEKYVPLIISLLKDAEKGTPIVRTVAYNENDDKYIKIIDEFFLGDNVLVCPQAKKESTRKVVLPKGTWISDLGETYKEGEYIIDTPLDRLPIFTRKTN